MRYIFGIAFFIITITAQAQKARVVDFTTLEKTLKEKTDTLKVVNFWASWCAPCIAEMKYFVQAGEAYKDQKVKFIYVSLDFSKNKDNVEKTFARHGLQGDLFILKDDPNAYVNKISMDWEGQIPVSVLVTEDGRYKTHLSQFNNFEELNNFIKEELK